MPRTPKVRPLDFYDTTPSLEHRTGDVWSSLPGYRLFGAPRIRGLVVTPACDLSNRKVETVTYVPIIPIRSYFSTSALIPDLVRELRGQLQNLSIDISLDSGESFLAPSLEGLEAVKVALAEIGAKPRLSEKEKHALTRALAGIKHLVAMHASSPFDATLETVKTLFGEKKLRDMAREIMRNRYTADVHFLPADGQELEWSGVAEHSVALFRYPLTAPTVVLDAAQDIARPVWTEELKRIEGRVPAAANYKGKRPLKHATIKPRFVADIIARFVSLHVRLGSPDFSTMTLEGYADELIQS